MCGTSDTQSSALLWEGFAVASDKEENLDETAPLGKFVSDI